MKRILFLCTGNSCRSQMAEGFARKYLESEYNIYSAGTKKHGMNQLAVKVMQEVGIDLSHHYSKTIEELEVLDFDLVVTVCDHAHENCPYVPAKRIVHKGFEDPPTLAKNMQNEADILRIYRRVRDEIEVFVKNMKSELEI